MSLNPKFKNYLILLLALTTAAGGALAWSQYQDLIKLRTGGLSDSARADLQKRLGELQKRKNELEAEVAGLRARSVAASQTTEGDEAGAAGDETQGRAGRFDRRNGMANFAALLANPEFNRLWAAQQKAALDTRYSALFKNLNLSPADLDKFKSLLVEKESALMDVMAAAREQGLNPRDPADRAQINSLVQAAQAQVDNSIRQTLGDSQFAQYQNYEQTLPQRNLVNQLTQSLSYTGTPLQAYQADQLVNILAASAPNQSQGAGGFLAAAGPMGGGMFYNRGVSVTDAAITQAQSVLSPPQLAALQQIQAQQQAQQQMTQIMRQTFSNQGPAQSAGSTTASASPPAPPPGD
ncbi:MAG: hypothetical protein PHE83_08985 [Opitutaceae bacterium]|nr:hypothetical protein [Opitutaceae bacterium]